MINIIGTIIFGAVIGFLAKFFKGAELSVLATVVLGVAGVLLGNLALSIFGYPANTGGIDWIRWVVCTLVAMAAIGIYAGTKSKK
ncbi:GlsB/YeaQ/YmgE family stress response membrane protein [Arcanobacterium pinnipediorum]|uniref:GlsB/YeaQ/YmgE family stress response membrane protein n=1 Tax=Arcanobacterium pinnipediorum TaxID=1503041 RepID=A0ABY5AGW6_9ACTO|nr:GlsB/YeaQ/YmgE family stress response membrane protein [Arcanobacterium pinnipediorum]USR79327.1 GlsB/YeaQ/YmgE family stress response membrane protein [Arcanobacterium pinnipediorum]